MYQFILSRSATTCYHRKGDLIVCLIYIVDKHNNLMIKITLDIQTSTRANTREILGLSLMLFTVHIKRTMSFPFLSLTNSQVLPSMLQETL